MNVTISPGPVNGTLVAPPSKSMGQRVLAGALLHRGTTIIRNLGTSDDERAALNVIDQLGACVHRIDEHTYSVTGSGVHPCAQVINCGESGLAARLFTVIAATCGMPLTITGRGNLMTRPMGFFADVLPQLGISVTTSDGCLPITLSGLFKPADITVDGSLSSQFLSGLLFAYAFHHSGPGHTITVDRLVSKPYIGMTLKVLELFGCEVANTDYREFSIDGIAPIGGGEVGVSVEGDWSSVAFLLVAGAVAGSFTVRGLENDRLQADSAIYDALLSAGALIEWRGSDLFVARSELRAFEFDATDCPDLFPVLAILAACAEGESVIAGVHRLVNKESNRAVAIADMLDRFGVVYAVAEDELCITGTKQLWASKIDAYGDHRMVMAACVGALRAEGPVTITGVGAVSKSYPRFFDDLVLCGAACNFSD